MNRFYYFFSQIITFPATVRVIHLSQPSATWHITLTLLPYPRGETVVQYAHVACETVVQYAFSRGFITACTLQVSARPVWYKAFNWSNYHETVMKPKVTDDSPTGCKSTAVSFPKPWQVFLQGFLSHIISTFAKRCCFELLAQKKWSQGCVVCASNQLAWIGSLWGLRN